MDTPVKAASISTHFKREAKLMVWWAVGVPAVLAAFAGLFGPYLVRYVAIDKCLDAGGRFDHSADICEMPQDRK